MPTKASNKPDGAPCLNRLFLLRYLSEVCLSRYLFGQQVEDGPMRVHAEPHVVQRQPLGVDGGRVGARGQVLRVEGFHCVTVDASLGAADAQ